MHVKKDALGKVKCRRLIWVEKSRRLSPKEESDARSAQAGCGWCGEARGGSRRGGGPEEVVAESWIVAAGVRGPGRVGARAHSHTNTVRQSGWPLARANGSLFAIEDEVVVEVEDRDKPLGHQVRHVRHRAEVVVGLQAVLEPLRGHDRRPLEEKVDVVCVRDRPDDALPRWRGRGRRAGKAVEEEAPPLRGVPDVFPPPLRGHEEDVLERVLRHRDDIEHPVEDEERRWRRLVVAEVEKED